MTKGHIAIAGAGIGGMITALLLKKQGFDVSIFEKEKNAGGRLAFIEREGYRIDKGPTIVLLPEMLTEILEEAGVPDEAWELIPLDTLYSVRFQDGTVYRKHRDKNMQKKEIARLFPGQEEGFDRYMKEMHESFKLGKASFLEKSFTKKKDFWTWKNIASLWKLKAYQSTKKYASNFFSDTRLQEAYSLQTLYIGGNPQTAPAMYSLIPYSEHEHGIHYVKGGYASLVDVLLERLRENKIPLYLDSKVEAIEKAGNAVTGIFSKGKKIKVDGLVWNGDFPSIQEVIEEEKSKDFTPSSGCLLLYFGVKDRYESDVHQFFMSSDFDQHMKEVFKEKKVPTDPSFYTFNPSIIDNSLAPEGKSVLYVLVPVPSGGHIDWSKEQGFINRMMERLESEAFPKLREKMEWMEVQTPNDAEMEGLYQGGSFGIAPELFQSGVFRPQAKLSPYKNVYATGASVHPGGGIPIVMQSARLAANQIVADFAYNSSKKDVNLHERIDQSISTL
ncbi:phytoene desaturase [Bacillus tianshenii]|uniref:phytoene desaturase family protein n=1 Tax=Sutcliffiella tianshenii TaxID=1463404 RepID=UPI001CD29D4C|nr:phytoene desaturase family protein [Bacillus tianshenii]MCA1320131.1 phytoene desaturase [Bacillus tianshenii]